MKNIHFFIFLLGAILASCSSNTKPHPIEISDSSFLAPIPRISCNCDSLLYKLLTSTNFNSHHNISGVPNYNIEDSSSSFYRIRVSELLSSGVTKIKTLGWIDIYVETGILYDITNDIERPIKLTFNKDIFVQYKSCLSLNKGTNIPHPKTLSDLMASKDSAYILNWQGATVFNQPDGKMTNVLRFADGVKVVDTVNNWIKISHDNNIGFIPESNLSQINVNELIADSTGLDEVRFNRYFGRIANLEKSNYDYTLSYKFSSQDISIEKAYQIMKLLLELENRNALPQNLPVKNSNTKNDLFSLNIEVKRGDKYIFEYFYSGGVTTGRIELVNNVVIVSIAYSAD